MNHIEVTPSQAKEILALNIRAGLVTMMKGSPSTAKSAIVADIAREYNLKLIDVRLAQCDPTDLLGFPQIDGNRARYVPMATFPLEGDPLPINPDTNQPYDGWLLFLDEFNSSDKPVQKASYKLILDRMIDQYPLHKKLAIVAAGNLDTDGAIVEEMSTALQSRLVHIRVRPDHATWLDWARNNGIDHRITSHVEFKPGNLYTFDPSRAEVEETYACYRTWEFANRQLAQIPDITTEKNALAIFASSLGQGVAREFLAYLRYFTQIPEFSRIVADPLGVKVPSEPGHLYALTGSLGQNADASTIDPVISYVLRLPMEFQVITLREIIRRHEILLQSAPIQDWVKTHGKELYQ